MSAYTARPQEALAAAVAELADAIDSLSGPLYQRPAREHVARAKRLLQQVADADGSGRDEENDDVAAAA